MSVSVTKFKPKQSFSHGIKPRLNGSKSIVPSQETGNPDLDKAIEVVGYSYDPKQDIFYSDMNPWQRNVGYCRLYDQAASIMGMIIDTEPIYFEYDGKKWMIGFWKGQYDLVTGGEIGVYKEALDLNLPGLFSGTFYNSVSSSELLQMSFTLKKNGKILFAREGKHWWLTGFKLGEFSEPAELTMEINLTLSDTAMRDAFVSGLRNAGYHDNEFTIDGNSISFTFAAPHTPQPGTRTKETDWIIQRKNESLCKLYQEITGPYDTVPEKLKALEERAPELYAKLAGIGKSKQLYQTMAALVMVGTLLISFFSTKQKLIPS